MHAIHIRSAAATLPPAVDDARSVIARQEFERRQIGNALHDRTIGNLAALSLWLRRIESALPRRTAAALKADIMSLHDQLAAAIGDVRDIARELRPVLLDRSGLMRAVEDYAERLSRLSGLKITVVQLTDRRLDPEQEAALFRIVQEALANCCQHAEARRVWIRYAGSATRIVLEVIDDGIGFQAPSLFAPGAQPGPGIRAMKERAELAGGLFALRSRPGKGTRIRIEFPA